MDNITFEQAMSRLEEIIAALENNQISLEKSVDLFQEGIKLSKICSDKLAGIEDKVANLSGWKVRRSKNRGITWKI